MHIICTCIYRYCSLLTKGANLKSGITEYPSTAPDSLRHWTPEQKSILEKSEKGKKLLDLETKQQIEWKQKYNSLDDRQKSNMSYKQFEWAMEAVHSRAFRGDFGALDGGEGGSLRKIASLLLPLSAIAFGIVYASDPSMDKYFLPLAIVAASPVGLTILADAKGSKEACLLPLIDSANHVQEANSVIEYNPANDSFELSLGRKSLVKEGDRAQACISYGIRKDPELLLNYGFLRGVAMEGTTDEIRQRLALEFVNRNDTN